MKNDDLGTLESMTKDSFTNYPQQAPEAIEEYLVNLSEEKNKKDKVKELKQKFKNNHDYFEQFKVAITHTSLMISILNLKATYFENTEEEDNINIDAYIREYLFFARKDDKDIYDMRLFYLNGLTGEELELNHVNEDEFENKEEYKEAVSKAEKQTKAYNILLEKLKNKYKETKIDLK
jgi:hypothetical protein